MKRFLIFVIPYLIIAQLNAQDSLEYAFDQARAHLAKREVNEAIKALRKVYVAKPDNCNINFLMGAAYTELPGNQSEAIFHLKKGLKKVKEDYIVGSFQETAAPIHIYYYMSIALVEEDKCAEANLAFQKFKEYGKKVNSYFIDEVDRHMQKCPFDEKETVLALEKETPAPEGYDPTFIEVEEIVELDSAATAERGLVTQKIEYTTNTPLYGVQVGSNLNPSPTSSYSKIKNVDVFIDNEGIIRYVVGHFSFRKQAESLLASIKEKGYEDAFVVNVNNERKYSNEVISYKNVNLRAGLKGNVEYYVQLGAFNDTVPKEMAELYFEIDGIHELKRDSMTVLVVGSYDKYQMALNQKDELTLNGIKDAFIVAYNKGKRISLEEAINYTD